MNTIEIVDLLDKIEEAGRNEKIELLKKADSEVSIILFYAYNPFIKYYITPPDLEGTEDGMEWQEEHLDILLRLSERYLTGQAAVEQLSDLIVSSNPTTAELLKRVINKDLKASIGVKTINAALPALIPYSREGRKEKPSIMLVKTFKESKAEYPLICAAKKDGVRGRFVFGEMMTRSNHKINGIGHIEDELDQYLFELDGELVVPGENFDSASGLIRSDDPTPNAVYWIFDCPSHPGTKVERLAFLKEKITTTKHIRIIPHITINDKKQLMKYYNWALSESEEGIVVYTPDHLYRDVRSYDWMRVVPKKTADCRCIGIYEGSGRLEGTLGGIIVNYKGHEVRVGSGFKLKFDKKQALKTAEEAVKDGAPSLTIAYKREEKRISEIIRDNIWAEPTKFIERLTTIEFKEETKKGSMRQPIFKFWRIDKLEENHE